MRIREYTPADFDALRRLHAAQGFGYPFPDLDSPLFVTKLVLEEGERELPAGREVPDHKSYVAGDLSSVTNQPLVAAATSGQAHHESRVTNHEPRVLMAVLLRLTAEAYLLHDPQASAPRERWENFLALQQAALSHAAALGLDDAQAFLPPRVARAFGRRLERLGWRRDPWQCFTRVTGG